MTCFAWLLAGSAGVLLAGTGSGSGFVVTGSGSGFSVTGSGSGFSVTGSCSGVSVTGLADVSVMVVSGLGTWLIAGKVVAEILLNFIVLLVSLV